MKTLVEYEELKSLRAMADGSRRFEGRCAVVSKRTYTPAEKTWAIAHLIACRGCVKEAARLSGGPRKTLEGWGKGRPNCYYLIRSCRGKCGWCIC